MFFSLLQKKQAIVPFVMQYVTHVYLAKIDDGQVHTFPSEVFCFIDVHFMMSSMGWKGFSFTIEQQESRQAGSVPISADDSFATLVEETV